MLRYYAAYVVRQCLWMKKAFSLGHVYFKQCAILEKHFGQQGKTRLISGLCLKVKWKSWK